MVDGVIHRKADEPRKPAEWSLMATEMTRRASGATRITLVRGRRRGGATIVRLKRENGRGERAIGG